MSDHNHNHNPPTPADMLLHGLYMAETEGPAAALDGPDPHRPMVAGANARASGTDLARARALIEPAELLATHTRGFSRPLLMTLLPALCSLRWLAWELGPPDADGSVLVPGGKGPETSPPPPRLR